MVRNAIQTMTGAAVLAGAGFLAILALASAQLPTIEKRADVTTTIYLPDIWTPRPVAWIHRSGCNYTKRGPAGFKFLGAITNTLNYPVSNVRVFVSIYDRSGLLMIPAKESFVAPSVILTEHIGLFYPLSSTTIACSDIDQIDHLEVQIVGWERSNNSRLRSLTVLSSLDCFDNCYPSNRFVTVRNEQTVSLTNMQVFAGGLDGFVGGTQYPYDQLMVPLAPMSLATFTLNSFGAGPFDSPIVAQGEIYP